MALGDVIRGARRQRELSQKDLAEKLKNKEGDPISPQYLNDIELNRRVPPSYLLEQIAQRLQLDGDALHVMAGQLPPNVRPDSHSPERLSAAMRAFRRTLR